MLNTSLKLMAAKRNNKHISKSKGRTSFNSGKAAVKGKKVGKKTKNMASVKRGSC